MKKIIAITIFCFFSLLIKSEKAICKIYCNLSGKVELQKSSSNTETNNSGYLQYDGFFNKI